MRFMKWIKLVAIFELQHLTNKGSIAPAGLDLATLCRLFRSSDFSAAILPPLSKEVSQQTILNH